MLRVQTDSLPCECVLDPTSVQSARKQRVGRSTTRCEGNRGIEDMVLLGPLHADVQVAEDALNVEADTKVGVRVIVYVEVCRRRLG